MKQQFTNIKISPITEKAYNGAKPNVSYLDEMFRFKKDYGKVFKFGNIFYLYRSNGYLWFRFFNKYGLHIKDKTKTIELFSERSGYKKFLDVGKYRIKLLK